MPTSRPESMRSQPGRYAELGNFDAGIRIQPRASNNTLVSFIPELSQTCAFPTWELNNPRRHPNEALVDFHRAAKRILDQPVSKQFHTNSNEGLKLPAVPLSSKPSSPSVPAVASASIAGTVQPPPRPLPTTEQIEDCLSGLIDHARERLVVKFSRWFRGEQLSKKHNPDNRAYNTMAITPVLSGVGASHVMPTPPLSNGGTQKRKAVDEHGGGSGHKKSKHEAVASPQSVIWHHGDSQTSAKNRIKRHKVDGHGRAETVTGSVATANTTNRKKDILITDGIDWGSSDDETAGSQNKPTSDRGTQQGLGSMKSKNKQNQMGRLDSLNPVAVSPAFTWNALPDNMKLIVVKEVTTWYPYAQAIAVLRLNNAQEVAFRSLYQRERQKAAEYETALRGYSHRCWEEHEVSHHRSSALLAHNALQNALGGSDTNSGVDIHAPGKGNYLSKILRYPIVRLPNLITDCVSVQDMEAGQAYLRSVGFSKNSADLGHWLGHSLSGRFEIDMSDHSNCPAGHHGNEREEGHRDVFQGGGWQAVAASSSSSNVFNIQQQQQLLRQQRQQQQLQLQHRLSDTVKSTAKEKAGEVPKEKHGAGGRGPSKQSRDEAAVSTSKGEMPQMGAKIVKQKPKPKLAKDLTQKPKPRGRPPRVNTMPGHNLAAAQKNLVTGTAAPRIANATPNTRGIAMLTAEAPIVAADQNRERISLPSPCRPVGPKAVDESETTNAASGIKLANNVITQTPSINELAAEFLRRHKVRSNTTTPLDAGDGDDDGEYVPNMGRETAPKPKRKYTRRKPLASTVAQPSPKPAGK